VASGRQVLFTNFLLNLDAVLMTHPSQSKNYKQLRSEAAMHFRQTRISYTVCII